MKDPINQLVDDENLLHQDVFDKLAETVEDLNDHNQEYRKINEDIYSLTSPVYQATITDLMPDARSFVFKDTNGDVVDVLVDHDRENRTVLIQANLFLIGTLYVAN